MPNGPILPFDQIIHTPLQPPELPLPGTRKTTNSAVSDCPLTLVGPICHLSTSESVLVPSHAVRRFFVIAPYNATPMLAPVIYPHLRSREDNSALLTLFEWLHLLQTTHELALAQITMYCWLLQLRYALLPRSKNRWPLLDHSSSLLGSHPRVMNVT